MGAYTEAGALERTHYIHARVLCHTTKMSQKSDTYSHNQGAFTWHSKVKSTFI